MKPVSFFSYKKVTVGVEVLSEGGSCERKLVRNQDSGDLRPNHQQHNDAVPLHLGENTGSKSGKRIGREADVEYVSGY